MRGLFAGLAVACMSFVVAPACSTKKFVNTRVGEVNDKVATLSGDLEKSQQRINEVDQKAGAAGDTARAAQAAATDAASQAAAAEVQANAIKDALAILRAAQDAQLAQVADELARLRAGTSPPTESSSRPRSGWSPPEAPLPSSPTPESAGESGDSANPVAAMLARFTRPASAAFVAPAILPRDKPTKVILRLSPPSTTPEQLAAALQARLGRPTVSDARVARMASMMTATLQCINPCEKILVNPPELRAVDLSEGTEWQWQVTPTRLTGATLGLKASVSVLIPMGKEQAPYPLLVHETDLQVSVSYAQRAGDMWGWLSSNHGLLTALAARGGSH
jgi:hypothetical protein